MLKFVLVVCAAAALMQQTEAFKTVTIHKDVPAIDPAAVVQGVQSSIADKLKNAQALVGSLIARKLALKKSAWNSGFGYWGGAYGHGGGAPGHWCNGHGHGGDGHGHWCNGHGHGGDGHGQGDNGHGHGGGCHGQIGSWGTGGLPPFVICKHFYFGPARPVAPESTTTAAVDDATTTQSKRS